MPVAVTYKGLSLVAAPYALAELDGLIGGTEVRTNDRPYVARDGVRKGSDWTGGKAVTVTLDVYADNEAGFNAALTAATAAFTPADADETPLGCTVPGVAAGNACILNVRPRRLSAPLVAGWLAGYHVQLVAELYATDPLKYSDPASSLVLSVSAGFGGFTWPVSWPITWPGVGSGTSTIATNTGTASTWPTVALAGPLVNPAVTHVNTGKRVSLFMTINSGETVVLDFAARTAIIGGFVNRYPYLTSAEWFALAPGANPLVLTADSGTGTATVTWRNAWQ